MERPLPKPKPKRRHTTAARARVIVLSFIWCVSYFFRTLEHNTLLKSDQQQLSFPPSQPQFQPTAFQKHIRLRQSNYAHHNNLTHSSKSTFGVGAGKNSHVRISFQLHDRNIVPLNLTFQHPSYFCPLGMIFEKKKKGEERYPTEQIRTGVLPPSLTNLTQSNDHPRGGRVLDFTATISTNLKILQIGHSVLVQLAQAFDEMVGCQNYATSGDGMGFCRPRVVQWNAWADHEGRSILSPTIGGGVSAIWR